MYWIERGGLLMWPLLAISLIALGVIFERLIAFTTTRFLDDDLEARLLAAEEGRDGAEALVEERAPVLLPLVRILLSGGGADRERRALVAIEDIARGLNRNLGILGLSGRVAPLLGLLGTIMGMIQTFSRLADVSGAVDMTTLADGIWQALLTTAAGLIVAVPAVAAHQIFLWRRDQVLNWPARLANLMLADKSPDAPS